MNQIEAYLEDNQVYELFESLLKQLVVEKPEDPLTYLVDALNRPKMCRVFFMGPPGCARTENSAALSEYFKWEHISAGDLLRKEVNKKTKEGERIEACFKSHRLVDDEIVIDLVSKEINEMERQDQPWILSGFPRTRVQALALQKMAIIPDKFINLKIRQQQSTSRIKQNCVNQDPALYGPELDERAN